MERAVAAKGRPPRPTWTGRAVWGLAVISSKLDSPNLERAVGGHNVPKLRGGGADPPVYLGHGIGAETVAAGVAHRRRHGASVVLEVRPGAIKQVPRMTLYWSPWTTSTGTLSSRPGVVERPASKGSVPYSTAAPTYRRGRRERGHRRKPRRR